VVVFNAIGGVLLYTTKDKDKAKKAAKTLDMNKGDDVFAHPGASVTPLAAAGRGGRK
jgi:hypothetical protein